MSEMPLTGLWASWGADYVKEGRVSEADECCHREIRIERQTVRWTVR